MIFVKMIINFGVENGYFSTVKNSNVKNFRVEYSVGACELNPKKRYANPNLFDSQGKEIESRYASSRSRFNANTWRRASRFSKHYGVANVVF
jgi:hypothetical protein